MNLLRYFYNEFRSRWNVVRNSEKGGIQRTFALLEIVCFPLSLLTVCALLVQVVLIRSGHGDVVPPLWKDCLSPVLVAAAIGYLTNWLAITMLFRPYRLHRWLFVWPQGMIPRNKPQVAKAVGDQVGNKLLSPEKIAMELSGRIVDWMQRAEVIASMKMNLHAFLTSHQKDIIDFLVPQIERTLLDTVDRMVNQDSIQRIWTNQIMPRLTNEENRQRIAAGFIAFFEENAPRFIEIVHERISNHVRQKISGIPFIGGLADEITEGVMGAFADKEALRNMLSSWLGEPQTQQMLEETIQNMCLRFGEWLKTPQGDSKLSELTDQSREKLKEKITAYLHDVFPKTVESALDSEKLWTWFETSALPTLARMLSDYITEHRQDIIDNLKLSERIETAINNQDVRQFHRMVNEISAEHLGAIQVLGFILGLLAGVLQLLQ